MRQAGCPCSVPVVPNRAASVVVAECDRHRARREHGRQDWRVVRHGGRATDRWRIVCAGDEFKARRVFDRVSSRLRQGAALLLGPPDTRRECFVWKSDSGPTLRTRW